MREIRLPLSAGASLSLALEIGHSAARRSELFTRTLDVLRWKNNMHARVRHAGLMYGLFCIRIAHRARLLSRGAMKIYQTLNCWTRAIIFSPALYLHC
jgi:acetylornithine/succinyldiaminopimelate/putrescine aminotransferase